MAATGALMAIALFGATAPEGVVWYTGQFYALIYLTAVLKLNYVTVYMKLPRFRGHRTIWVRGVHDGQDKSSLPA